MPSSVGRELKRSVGDQLRGMRCLVRMLGSDAQRPGLAPPALPEVLPELDRLVGRTFRAVDTMLSTVETAVATVRPASGPFRGFAPFEAYFSAAGAERLQEDLYRGLKAVAAAERPNQLVLKARLAAVAADLAGERETAPQEAGAALLRALVRRKPLVDFAEEGGAAAILRQYVALALLFAVFLRGAPPEAEASALIEDALLIAGTRLDAISAALAPGESGDRLPSLLAGLADHLA